MPVIVARAQHDRWLEPADAAAGAPDSLLVPWAHGGLEVRAVSRRVNDARNQGAELVDPLGMATDPA
jgi:putative SOS response-associated peptidase YedK